MSHRKALIGLLLGIIAVTGAGCAWFVLGGAGGVFYALSLEDDETVVNLPPSVTLTAPVANALVSDRVVVKFTLIDPEEEDCSVQIAYSTDGGTTWNPATEVASYPSEGTTALTSTAAGQSHAFVWNSFQDLSNENFPDTSAGNGYVRVSITPTDAGGETGSPVVSGDFRLYNGFVSTFFGGEFTDLLLAFPSSLYWKAGSGSADQLYVNDEFQSRSLALDLDSGGMSVIAGTGNSGYTGDNLPADTTGLTNPGKMCTDAAGNYYIADTAAHRVRRVDAASGFITTVAGTGERGYEGDGGAPANAMLSHPSSVAHYSSTSPPRSILYIADGGNNAVRAVNMGSAPVSVAGINIAPGTIVTVLGDPEGDYSPERDGPSGIPGSVGIHASHKVDSNGRSHVAYYDETSESLKYVHNDGIRWVNETVDLSGDVGEHCALALDVNDRPHISYYDSGNGALKYAHFDGNAWQTVTVDSNGDPGYYTSIGTYLNTVPVPNVVEVYISYYDDQNSELRVAHWNGTFWFIEVIYNGSGYHTSLAVDSTDEPHVAFYHHQWDELYYFYKVAGTWTDHGNAGQVHNSGGEYCSLALDQNDRARIAFYDANTLNGSVLYTWWNGANWPGTPATVDDGDRGMGAGNEYDVGRYCSLALNSLDYAFVAYYDADNNNGSLTYSFDSNGDNDFVDANERGNYADGHQSGTWDDIGEWASLAMWGNQPRIVYVHWEQTWPTNSARLRYAFWVTPPGAFALRLLDSGITAGLRQPRDLKLDNAGNLFIAADEKIRVLNTGTTMLYLGGILVPPFELRTLAGIPSPMTGIVHVPGAPGILHVVYSDPTNGKLYYATALDTGGPWVREVVPDASVSCGEFCSLAVDSSGDIHVAYYDDASRNLKYAVKSGVNWTIETPEGAAATGIGQFASLALDGSEDPAIAYYDKTNYELKYVSRSGGSWGTPEVVDDGGGGNDRVGRFCSLAFDGTNTPGIAYHDGTNQALKYAYRTGGSPPWTPSTVDSTEPAGKWASLDYDSSDYFHISYYCDLRNVLKHAYDSASGVQREVVDGFGDVGKHSRIFLDSADIPHIAYIDSARGRGILSRKPGTHWERYDFGHDGAAYPCIAYDAANTRAFVSYSRPFRSGEIRVQTMPFGMGNWTESTVYSPDFGEQFGGDGRFALNAIFSQITGFDLALYGTQLLEYDAIILADADNSRVRVINLNDPLATTSESITVANRTIEAGRVDTILGNGDFTYDANDDGAVVDNAVSPVEVAMPQDVTVDDQGNIFVADAVNQRIRALNTGSTTMTWCGVQVPPGAIDTIAGGDSNVSVTASTFYPSGLAVDDSNGDVYISDYIGAVFRVDPVSRTHTVVAGFGAFGFAGDGGPAASAEFWAPHDVAIDGERNIYILDRGNLRVRAVNLYNAAPYSICGRSIDPGNIDTILGTGVITFSIDGPGGNPADEYGEAVPSTQATVTEVINMAIDRRNPLNGQSNPRGILYVGDRQNRRVRAVNLNPSGTITIGLVPIAAGNIATVMGSGVALWRNDGPGGSDPTDDFFPDSLPLTVPISQTGPVALDPSGVLLVMDGDYRVVYAFNTSMLDVTIAGVTVSAGKVQHVAGDYFGWREFNGDGIPAVNAQFDEPSFMLSWRDTTGTSQEIYISERRQQRIRLIDEWGIIGTFVGNGDAGYNGDGVPPANVLVNEPADMAIYESGGFRYIYYVDSRNRRVRRWVK